MPRTAYNPYYFHILCIVCEAYGVYRGDRIVALKKTESITYRTDTRIKSILAAISAEKKWTISQLTEEIIREWLQEKHPELLTDEQ